MKEATERATEEKSENEGNYVFICGEDKRFWDQRYKQQCCGKMRNKKKPQSQGIQPIKSE